MAGLKKGPPVIDDLDVSDPHDIFRPRNRVEKSEWHLNIDKNDNAIKIAEKFRQEFKTLEQSSSITREIDTIETIFLKFLPTDHQHWYRVRNCFKQAHDEDSPIPIIKAYIFYCTPSNCVISALTQEYTEAFIRIFFHPNLEEFLVRKIEVYRGTVLEDRKLVDNYKEGAIIIIIITTFLSASTDPLVAKLFSEVPPGNMNMISLFCTYNVNNTDRHTALNLKDISPYPEEEEILILHYVPFTIRSVERTEDGREIKICLDECPKQCTV